MNYTYILPVLTLITMSSISAATPVDLSVASGNKGGESVVTSTAHFPVPRADGIAARNKRAGSTASTPRSLDGRSVGGESSFTVASTESSDMLPVLSDTPSFDDVVEYASALLKQYQTLRSKRSATNLQVKEYLQRQILKLEAVSGAVVREPDVRQSLRVLLETSISRIVQMHKALEERTVGLARENKDLAEVRDRALLRTNALTAQVATLTGELAEARKAAAETRRPVSPDIDRGRASYHTIDGREGYTQIDDGGVGEVGDATTSLLGNGQPKTNKKAKKGSGSKNADGCPGCVMM